MNLIHPKHSYTQLNADTDMDMETLEGHTRYFWWIALTWRKRQEGLESIQTSTALRYLETIQEDAPQESRVRASAYVLQQAIILG